MGFVLRMAPLLATFLLKILRIEMEGRSGRSVQCRTDAGCLLQVRQSTDLTGKMHQRMDEWQRPGRARAVGGDLVGSI